MYHQPNHKPFPTAGKSGLPCTPESPAKSRAGSTAGSQQLSHRSKPRQRNFPSEFFQNSSLHLRPRPSALKALSLIISTFLCVHTATWAALAVLWRWDAPVPWPQSKSRRGCFLLTVSFCKSVQLLHFPTKLPRTFSRLFLVLLLS